MGEEERGSTWARRTFAALRVPAFRRFFISQGISLVGSFARATALGWLVYDLTGSKLLLGTVGLASYLPIAILAPLAGAAVDRIDRRRLLIGANVVFFVCAAALAVFTGTGVVRTSHVIGFALLTGVAAAFEIPARQAFFVDMVGKGDLRNAIALNAALFDFTIVLGPLLAATLLATLGMTAVFVVDALTFVVGIVGFAGMRVTLTAVRTTDPRDSAWRRLTAGFRYALSDRFLRSLLVLLGVVQFFAWSYWALLPAFARDVLHQGTTGYAVLYASSGAGAFLGALFVAGHGDRHLRTALVSFLLGLSLAVVGFALARTLALAVLLRAVAGFSMIGFIVTATTSMQLAVPDDLRGRVIGVWTLVWGTCYPLGRQALAAAAERIGTVAAIAGGGLVCLAATLVVVGRAGLHPAPPAAPSA